MAGRAGVEEEACIAIKYSVGYKNTDMENFSENTKTYIAKKYDVGYKN